MNTTATIIIAIVAALVSCAITSIVAVIVHKSKMSVSLTEHEKLFQQYADQAIEEKTEQLEYVNAALAKKEQEITTLQMLMDEKENSFNKLTKEAKENYERTIADLRNSQQQQLKAITDKMTADTEKILKQREDELKKNNKDGIEDILKPLKESIIEMKDAMAKNAESHVQKNAELSKQLEMAVKEMQQKTSDIGVKADELANALSSKPKFQGCFGETFLEDILAQEGMEPGKHYEREKANDDQSRPDFVFHFKEGLDQKDLIVDSKVSLTAFVRYMNAESEEEKDKALDEHITSINNHVSELVQREYQRKVSERNLFADYVLMFMPYDAAYRVAIDKDPLLWQNAYNKGVLIVTEQTIVPFLKIMKLTWNKYQHDANMIEIEKAATNMIDRVGAFYDSYTVLGKKISAVCKEYNLGVVKLQDHGPSITTAAQQVMKFGVKRSKGKELEVPVAKVQLNGVEESMLDLSFDE